MSFILGDVTLLRPKAFFREQIEKSASVVTLSNRTKKDITGRKERFTLKYTMLTQTEVNDILTEWGYETTRNFSVNETNLTISSTPVHITVERREYNTAGGEYREDITLILEEVI